MMSDSLKKVINLLLNKTKAKKAFWSKTSGKGEYKIMLDDTFITINIKPKSVFSVAALEGDQANFSMYNRHGRLIETLSYNSIIEKDDFEIINTLYNEVNKQYQNNIDKEYQTLIEKIEHHETIGLPDINSKDLL